MTNRAAATALFALIFAAGVIALSLPVHIAGPSGTAVSCSGVDAQIADIEAYVDGEPGGYVDRCEHAVNMRLAIGWPLTAVGLLGLAFIGMTAKREPAGV